MKLYYKARYLVFVKGLSKIQKILMPLLFHKNLWIFQRFAEDSPICQNSRIRQLNSYFYLDNRIITANSTIDDSQVIDFNTFEVRLKELKDSSINCLKQALQ